MIKAVHTWCGKIIPDVTIKVEQEVDEIELFGTIPTKHIPPTFEIMYAPKYCPVCHLKLYQKDIVLVEKTGR